MNIEFSQLLIKDVIFNQINHISTHTDYGFDVNDKLGIKTEFWKKDLLEQLKEAKSKPEILESIVERLNKNLNRIEHLNLLLQHRREQKWEHMEIVVNHELLLVLLAFPKEFLGCFLTKLTNSVFQFSGSTELVSLKTMKEGKAISLVEPDVLLLDGKTLTMIEIKINSAEKYRQNQLLNYAKLIHECKNTVDNNIIYRPHLTEPRQIQIEQFIHILITPHSFEEKKNRIFDTEISNFFSANGMNVEVNYKQYSEKFPKEVKYLQDLESALKDSFYYSTWDDFLDKFKGVVAIEKSDPYQAHWLELVKNMEMVIASANKPKEYYKKKN